MNRRKPFGALTSEEHYRTAYEVATEGIVLLKMGQVRNSLHYYLFPKENINVFWL